ncbi:uncharacterized protein SPPG_01192 [Spizellomyces punctatus DAOM BR117]|uniref:RRM domain-containing protein n=1 Tax=Spizellomyces punctatus (strain DAOM BR117) TaxID=645134 RepID=A0A0L0HSA7_SPIPD|nr:uncharacterized protein SPPG_01192 [Spizellomyces punctatus DAOM BR117]KND03734.1 hypothetical protein SPPG_01192 [Spizellomyces punctatus DAOM BR117]|eukprot:XP_016611773.1 hypothetical protein SPPG_01192 [Spizellomyces punctatus DAOM BR117]
MTSIPPNQTLYIRNLNEKVQKEDIRRNLYYLFSQHGHVLDVVALKTIKMRGQAFVVFRDISSATTAMRALQEFPFFDKNMKISFAKTKSNAVRFHEGVYTAPAKETAPSTTPAAQKRPREDEEESEAKRTRSDQQTSQEEEAESANAQASDQTQVNPPNRILFLTNLPTSVSEDMLAMLFQQYPGFKEIRLVPGKSGIAFVEYESDAQAETAKGVLNGFKLTPTHPMTVEYAKR